MAKYNQRSDIENGGRRDPIWTRDAVAEDCTKMCTDNECCRATGFISGGCFCLGIFIFVIVIISLSVERIDSQHYGIPYSTVNGRITNKVQSAGLHSPGAFATFILWHKTYSSRTERVTCNSQDGVRINLIVDFQYLPRKDDLYSLTNDYIDEKKYRKVLNKHSRTAIRNACAEFTTQEFQTDRAQVQTSIFEKLIAIHDLKMKTDVIDVQLSNIERPASYESEVDEKEAARNDIDQAENEREQEITQAETVLFQAQIAANRTIDLAETNAENTLTAAKAEAEVITSQYEDLADSYYQAQVLLELDDQGLIDYMKTRLIAQIEDGSVAIESPE